MISLPVPPLAAVLNRLTSWAAVVHDVCEQGGGGSSKATTYGGNLRRGGRFGYLKTRAPAFSPGSAEARVSFK